MRYSFQLETWGECVDELRPLWQLHWQEIAVDQDLFKPDMDEKRYQDLERFGMLRIITARYKGDLIGYVKCFVMPHFHYKSSGLMGLADMYFVLPEFRNGVGVKLLLAMESVLRNLQVRRINMSCKVHFDQQALFEHLGYTFTDKTFGKVLCP